MMMVMMIVIVVVVVIVVMIVVMFVFMLVVMVMMMFMLMVMVVMVMLTLLHTVDRHAKAGSCDTAFDSGNGLNLYIGYAKSIELTEEALLVVDKLIQRG